MNDGKIGSADDLIPLLIYVVANTPFKSLYSNCKFIENYAADDDRSSEPYYFFVSLQNAVGYLGNESVESISSKIKEMKLIKFQIIKNTLIVC